MLEVQSYLYKRGMKERYKKKFRLIVLDPEHFHAALLQDSMYEQIDPRVRVYSPQRGGINEYLELIYLYNNRPTFPTHWEEKVYKGSDYLQKMIKENPGRKNVVMIAGNNRKKIHYITKSIAAGKNVLSDKPMVINSVGFKQLIELLKMAEKRKVLLYDIMAGRYAITNIIERMIIQRSDIFGKFIKGTLQNPAIIFKSVHHFYKEISSKLLIRPTWYFDVCQQGEGIVDVTTHLIDLIQWECFPETEFDYLNEVHILFARRWPTKITLPQFSKVTGKRDFPAFLKKDVKGNKLYVYSNGEIHYTIKGIHTQVIAEWRFAAPNESADTFYSMIKGTKATLIIRQEKAQNYKPSLYVLPVDTKDKNWRIAVRSGFKEINKIYPGISAVLQKSKFKVVIPDGYETEESRHFGRVIEQYLQYLEVGCLPKWEKSFMLTKYYITTNALEMAKDY